MADECDDIHSLASGKDAPVDIESMQVKILVVCKDERRLESMASFLNRRGWETKVTSKIKEALDLVSTMKPDFVLISVNHPNPKLSRLPLVIKQTFQIPCVGFCEVGGAKSMGLLQHFPVDHRLPGLASGPNAQRCIKQILREIYHPESTKTERRSLGVSENEDMMIRISGGVDEFGDRDIPTLPPVEDDEPDVIFATPEMLSEELQLDPAEIEEIIRGIQKDYPSRSAISNDTQELMDFELPNDESPEIPAPLQRSQIILTEQDLANRELSRDPKNPTYFEKLVKKIMNDIPGAVETCENRLHVTDHIALLSIQSATTSGFLILANSASSVGIVDVSSEFVEGLTKFLREEGKILEIGPLTYLLTEEHSFFAHQRETLEFAHLRPIGNGEMGVKFIADSQPVPKLFLDEKNEKYRFSATAISSAYPVDFRIYLHLEKNQKFVVLVKEGGHLNQKYKDRLEELGKGLFIKKADAELLKRYAAAVKAAELLKVNAKEIKYGQRKFGKKAA